MPFPDLAHTLPGEPWKNNKVLAEQLYAIFMTYRDGIQGPLKVHVPEVTDPLTGERVGDGNPFEFVFPDGRTKAMDSSGQVSDATNDPITGETQKKEPLATSFIGKISSGSGKTYQVAIYDAGLDRQPLATVTAEQQNLKDESGSLPAGWVVQVLRSGDKFYLLEPVWLRNS